MAVLEHQLNAHEEHLGIAEVAERTGLSAHTLRYYERAGLLDEVDRDAAGHRRFGPNDLARLRFVNYLRATGMPIRDVRRYVDLVRAGDETTAARYDLLQRHKEAVCARLGELQACLDAIEVKLDRYRNHLGCPA